MKLTSFISSSKELWFQRGLAKFVVRTVLFTVCLTALDRLFLQFQHTQKDVFSSTSAVKEKQVVAKSRESLSLDVLCIGSSHVQFGIDPRGFTDHAEGAVYNAAIGGWTSPANNLLMARSFLEKHRVKTIVYGIDSFGMNAAPNGSVSLATGAPRELFFLTNAGRFAANFWQYCQGIYQDGWHVSQVCHDPYDLSPFLAYERHEVQPNGWVEAHGIARPDYLRYSQTGFSPDPGQWRALQLLVELCREKQVRLVLVHIPEYYTARAIRPDRYRAFETALLKFAAEQQVEYYDFNRLDRFPLRDLSLFFDSDHLNATGARRFTAQLADVLAGKVQCDRTPDPHEYRTQVYDSLVQVRAATQTGPVTFQLKSLAIGNSHQDVTCIDFTQEQTWRRVTGGLTRRMWTACAADDHAGRPVCLSEKYPQSMFWTAYEVTAEQDGPLEIEIDLTLPEPLTSDLCIDCLDKQTSQFVPWCTIAQGTVGRVKRRFPLPQPFPGAAPTALTACRIEATDAPTAQTSVLR